MLKTSSPVVGLERIIEGQIVNDETCPSSLPPHPRPVTCPFRPLSSRPTGRPHTHAAGADLLRYVGSIDCNLPGRLQVSVEQLLQVLSIAQAAGIEQTSITEKVGNVAGGGRLGRLLARLRRPATSTTTKKEKKSAEGKLLEVKTLLWVELKERRLQLALVPLAFGLMMMMGQGYGGPSSQGEDSCSIR